MKQCITNKTITVRPKEPPWLTKEVRIKLKIANEHIIRLNVLSRLVIGQNLKNLENKTVNANNANPNKNHDDSLI